MHRSAPVLSAYPFAVSVANINRSLESGYCGFHSVSGCSAVLVNSLHVHTCIWLESHFLVTHPRKKRNHVSRVCLCVIMQSIVPAHRAWGRWTPNVCNIFMCNDYRPDFSIWRYFTNVWNIGLQTCPTYYSTLYCVINSMSEMLCSFFFLEKWKNSTYNMSNHEKLLIPYDCSSGSSTMTTESAGMQNIILPSSQMDGTKMRPALLHLCVRPNGREEK